MVQPQCVWVRVIYWYALLRDQTRHPTRPKYCDRCLQPPLRTCAQATANPALGFISLNNAVHTIRVRDQYSQSIY